MGIEALPHLNVILNAASAILLACGYRAIRQKRVGLHARFMLAASGASALFLASYLTYHAIVLHKPYPGGGWLRGVYLTILLSHILLAFINVPLVLSTLYLALKGRIDRHRRLARWTFPIWSYVSITGVIVYLMLYVFTPATTR